MTLVSGDRYAFLCLFSLQAIACAAAYTSEWPLLVICPSSARYHWRHELLKWLDEGSVAPKQIAVVCNSKQALEHDSTRVVIVSYELVSKSDGTYDTAIRGGPLVGRKFRKITV